MTVFLSPVVQAGCTDLHKWAYLGKTKDLIALLDSKAVNKSAQDEVPTGISPKRPIQPHTTCRRRHLTGQQLTWLCFCPRRRAAPHSHRRGATQPCTSRCRGTTCTAPGRSSALAPSWRPACGCVARSCVAPALLLRCSATPNLRRPPAALPARHVSRNQHAQTRLRHHRALSACPFPVSSFPSGAGHPPHAAAFGGSFRHRPLPPGAPWRRGRRARRGQGARLETDFDTAHDSALRCAAAFAACLASPPGPAAVARSSSALRGPMLSSQYPSNSLLHRQEGACPLHLAAAHGKPSSLHALLERYPESYPDSYPERYSDGGDQSSGDDQFVGPPRDWTVR